MGCSGCSLHLRHQQLYLKNAENVPVNELRFIGELPKDRLKKKFTLSTGPGGQNVNKIATKAEIRFRVDEADWIPKRLREYFMERCAGQINKDKEWYTTSTTHRTQIQNLEECYSKLQKCLRECSDELIEKMRTPSQEDVEVMKAKQEQAEKYRRMQKDRLAFKKRSRQIF